MVCRSRLGSETTRLDRYVADGSCNIAADRLSVRNNRRIHSSACAAQLTHIRAHKQRGCPLSGRGEFAAELVLIEAYRYYEQNESDPIHDQNIIVTN
jgi:hypothetical protein